MEQAIPVAREDAADTPLLRSVTICRPSSTKLLRNGSGVQYNRIEAALERFPDPMTDGSQIFLTLAPCNRLRGDLSNAVQSAKRSGNGNWARLLRGLLREVDQAMENASEGYLQANRNFTQATRNIDAIEAGSNAARRGRVEDTIPAFNGLTPEGQQAFRADYVDPLIADALRDLLQ
jgi:hypothetical protein